MRISGNNINPPVFYLLCLPEETKKSFVTDRFGDQNIVARFHLAGTDPEMVEKLTFKRM